METPIQGPRRNQPIWILEGKALAEKYAAAIAIGMVVLAVGWWMVHTALQPDTPPPAVSAAAAQLSVVPSVICGLYSDPTAVVGIPTAVSDRSIQFADGYLLQLKQVPSLYLQKRAAFGVKDGAVNVYRLVNNDFNPCPPTK